MASTDSSITAASGQQIPQGKLLMKVAGGEALFGDGFVVDAFQPAQTKRVQGEPGMYANRPVTITFNLPTENPKQHILEQRIMATVGPMLDEEECTLEIERTGEGGLSFLKLRSTTGPRYKDLVRLQKYVQKGHAVTFDGITPIWCMELDGEEAYWEKLQTTLQERLGTGPLTGSSLHVEKDQSSKVIRLFTSGDNDTDEMVEEIIRNIVPFRKTIAVMEGSLCVACDDKASLTLSSCGHSYCSECFNNYALSEFIPLTCFASQGCCGMEWPAKEIAEIVPATILKTLSRRALQTYLQTERTRLFQCPSGKCDVILRADVVGLQYCEGCTCTICTYCKATNHQGLTCADFEKARGEVNVYTDENGSVQTVKKCPCCEASIVKLDGCNQVRCPKCKVYLCYICLNHFKESEDVYWHMEQDHPDDY